MQFDLIYVLTSIMPVLDKAYPHRPCAAQCQLVVLNEIQAFMNAMIIHTKMSSPVHGVTMTFPNQFHILLNSQHVNAIYLHKKKPSRQR